MKIIKIKNKLINRKINGEIVVSLFNGVMNSNLQQNRGCN